MSYSGYRLKIGDTIIKNTMIAPESYSLTKEERVIYTWKDANQVEHRDMADTLKAKINFSVRERTAAEQSDIAPVFASLKNLSVEYWDDIVQDYVIGNFYMQAPSFQTVRHGASLLYRATPITLIEY